MVTRLRSFKSKAKAHVCVGGEERSADFAGLCLLYAVNEIGFMVQKF
jgi:hypothetical protein